MATNTTAGGQDPNPGRRFARWRRFASAHPVLSNIGILATGTAAGQAIAIAVSVVTARLFTPEAFGEFALFSSIAGIFAVIATLRYDLAIVLPETDDEARQLARLATRANLVVSLTATLLAFLYRDTVAEIWSSPTLATWLPLVGLSVFCAAQISIWQYWFNRKRQYRVIALNRFTQSVGTSGGQLGFGLGGMRSFLGLLCGSFIGLVWALFNLGRQSGELRRRPGTDAPTIRQAARRHRKMPLLNLPNALVDAVRNNGIQMLIGVIALGSLGQFNLAWRVLQAPIALLNGAIAQVFLERMSRVQRGELTGLVRAVMKRAILFAVLPFGLLWLLAPWLIPLVFGSQWVEAGLITRALVPWLAMNLVTSPISNVFVVTSRQQWVLIHAIVFTVIPLAWLFFSPLEFLDTLQILSIMMALMLGLLLVLADLAARAYDHEVPSGVEDKSPDGASPANQENRANPVETKPEIEGGDS
ncbi:lipopolysaccharide biosynthesis protein [Mobiluncus mulieris]|uniref:lipopolysaccharide biosynthesis protein n=1 Tax=Mobiluncus mulieris TaxID=2052 RepID=UPI0024312A7D|nr:oligosaccharide flippase family protein [Mobiluncus mulieris]